MRAWIDARRAESARSGRIVCDRRLLAAVAFVLAARAAGAQVSAGAAAAPAPGSAGPAAAVETLSVAQAVQEALDHNPGLAARRLDLTAADARIVTAGLKPNPVFSFDADHLDWLGTGFSSANGAGPTEFGWRVDTPIERGGKRESRIQESTTAKSVAQAQLDDAIRVLKGDVQVACADLAHAEANLELARDTLRNYEDLANLTAARVSAGAAAPFEATRARVAMLQYRATVSRAELDLRTASIHLRQLLGRPDASEPLAVAVAPIGTPAAPPPLADLETLALERRADMQAARLTEARTRADLQLQLAIGKVDLTWGAEYRRQTVTGHSNSVGLFLSVPLPIHDRNQGEIARATAEGRQSTLQTTALEAGVRAEVRSAYEDVTSTGALVASFGQDLVDAARSARDIAAYTYRAGGSTLVELLDSQRAWNDAMQSYQDAQADYRRAVARLNTSVGTEVIR